MLHVLFNRADGVGGQLALAVAALVMLDVAVDRLDLAPDGRIVAVVAAQGAKVSDLLGGAGALGRLLPVDSLLQIGEGIGLP